MILLLLTASSTSYSAPEPQRARLAKGARAPFAGVLLTDQALAKVITKLEGTVKALSLRLEKQKREAQAKAAAAKKVCDAQLEGVRAKDKAAADGFKVERKLYTSALDKAQAPSPWYKSPYLHFILGSVVSGGVCAAATAGARQ